MKRWMMVAVTALAAAACAEPMDEPMDISSETDMRLGEEDQGTMDQGDPMDMAPPGDMGVEMGVDMNTSDMPGGMDMDPGMGSKEDVPTNNDDIFAYLQRGDYLDFRKEAAVHPSTGPHGGNVLTFVNKALADSLDAGNTSHPVGSASVKELYLSSTTEVGGWAAGVKVADMGQADDWYWYEVFSTASNASPVADGRGVGLCANCHAAGTDYWLSPWPFCDEGRRPRSRAIPPILPRSRPTSPRRPVLVSLLFTINTRSRLRWPQLLHTQPARPHTVSPAPTMPP